MEELEKAQLRIKKLIGEVAQNEETIKACNDIIADRDKMIDKMRGKLKRLDDQNSELAEKLTSQHEEMQKQNNVLQNRNSSLQDQIEEMQFTINDKQREIDQVKNGWDKDVETMQEEIGKLTEQVNNLAAGATQKGIARKLRIEDMQRTINRYKASLEEAQAALDVERGEREVVTRERDELQDRVSAMIASNNQKVDEFNELGESNQNLQAKIKEAEENYNSLRREFFLLSGAVDGLLMVRNAQRMGDA